MNIFYSASKPLVLAIAAFAAFLSGMAAKQSTVNAKTTINPNTLDTPLKISRILFSKDNQSLSVLAGDRLISVWNSRERKPVASRYFDDLPITAMAWEGSGANLLAGTNRAKLLRLDGRSLAVLNTITHPVEMVTGLESLGDSGRFVLMGSSSKNLSGTLQQAFFTNPENNSILELSPSSSPLSRIHASQNDKKILAGTITGDLLELGTDSTLPPKVLCSVNSEIEVIRQANGVIAIGTSDGFVHVYPEGAKGIKKVFSVGNKPMRNLEISTDGKRMFFSLGNERIQMVDLVTLNPISHLTATPEMVSAMAISNDGKTLAVGSSQGNVVLWNLEDFQVLAILPAGVHSTFN